jgi:basic membrane lipoprotein Med (substrate-binding protein (PBP1-ABC) superfamily)
MKIKPLIGLLAIAFAFGCTAGDSSGTGTTGSTAGGGAPAADEFKVALLTPGPVSDAGWSSMAYDGLQAIKSDMNATVDNQEASDVGKIRDAMRSYAQKGYQLVFGHGYEYNEVGVQVAKDFPNTVFVSSSGGQTAPNAGAFRFYLEQGCYLAGYLAGKMSKTGKIGSVAVINVPSINSTLKAYEAGAKAANPNITVLPIVYFGKEGDVAAAKQATEGVIAQGADFVIHQANAAAQGVFDACKAHNVHAFGTNLNQNENPSGAVVASATIVAKPAFLDLAAQVKAKSYKGQVSLYGMDKGAIDFVLNPVFESQIPEALRTEIATLKENIKGGKVVVPKDEF